MSNVVGLRGVPVPPAVGEPVEQLIACLEGLLEKARSGEIIGLCGTVAYADDGIANLGAGYYLGYDVLGKVTALQHHLIMEMAERG